MRQLAPGAHRPAPHFGEWDQCADPALWSDTGRCGTSCRGRVESAIGQGAKHIQRSGRDGSIEGPPDAHPYLTHCLAGVFWNDQSVENGAALGMRQVS